jgi:hypothetical protein
VGDLTILTGISDRDFVLAQREIPAGIVVKDRGFPHYGETYRDVPTPVESGTEAGTAVYNF